MSAAFGYKGYVLLTLLQFVYPFIGKFTSDVQVFFVVDECQWFINSYLAAIISYNVVVGDTLTRVLMYYAELDESSPWARRELITSIVCLCITLPLTLGFTTYCTHKGKQNNLFNKYFFFIGNGMAKFAKFSLISLVITGFVLCTMIYRLFTFGPSV